MEGTQEKRIAIEIYPPKSGPKTIVVLGVERGGTSMVAGVIRAFGVYLGERAARNHENSAFLTDDEDKLIEQIKKHNDEYNLWGFKVPKASLKVDFYNQNLRNPHYVLVFRNIASTVDSWCARGNNNPVETAKHCLNYYGKVIDVLGDSKQPLLFVNYERACNQREEIARLLAEFIGIEANDEALSKASSIITGDGGGYMDLPEYYFHISPINVGSELSNPIAFNFEVSEDGFKTRASRRIQERLIINFDKKPVPKEVYLRFNLDGEGEFFLENGLRVYLDFKDKLFAGHAFRPQIRKGRNVIRVLTNGNAKRIALGSLRQGANYSVSDLECFLESSQREELQQRVSSYGFLFARVKRFLKLIIRKTYGA